ncbi:MAG: sulfite exporter TauE/SafE family protein [Bacteroidetes bacterium]|nr:sulfite exporter TauE/SafE family protein [Bacteroidota bacterium]
MSFFIAAISLGFLGSFHCVGMCGPITLLLPLNNDTSLNKIAGTVLYNLGRITTYTLLGGLFGLLGQTFVLAGYQQLLSVTIGTIILIIAVLPDKITNSLRPTGIISGIITPLKNSLRQYIHNRSLYSRYFIGTLNGLLPCGLVYMGIAGAMATGNSASGALFMAIFGLGTFPVMFAISLFGSNISVDVRQKINRAVPVFIISMAILLILRGANLGIPYISPKLVNTESPTLNCCRK